MDCRQTPQPARGLSGHLCPESAEVGWPLFWLLFSGHAEKSDSPSEGGRKLLIFGGLGRVN